MTAASTPGPGPGGGRVVLIRHGQTEWSASGRHTSVTDLALTATGEAQAAALPELLAGLDIVPAAVWCSPRRRSALTAELAGLTIDRVDPDLAEWDYGDYEGLTTAEIRQERPGWQLFRDGCPGGETPQQATDRADRLLARVETRLAQHRDDGDLVMVCHGHISRVLTVRWVALAVEAGALVAMDPAAATVLGETNGERIILHANVMRLRETDTSTPAGNPRTAR
jgi:probable phosphoglycerate mutase